MDSKCCDFNGQIRLFVGERIVGERIAQDY